MSRQLASFELLKSFSGLIHRQPIFTQKLSVDSYHLSFLDHNGNRLNDDSKVPEFIQKLSDILPVISDHQKALISVPESWRDALYDIPKSPFDLILDINGSAVSNDHANFQFASHAKNTDDNSTTNTLLIDMQRHDLSSLTQHLSSWRAHHKILCATNVNGFDSYTLCEAHKLDLFQGQFYTLPTPTKETEKILPSQQVVMELLVKLQDPLIEPEGIAATINQDVTLSYKLLRLINSAFYGLPREINSIKEAIVMLGANKIKTWASLLCLSGVEEKPVELRVVAMTRAKMCELIAPHYKGSAELFFSAGLFSTLDALMDKPIATLVEKLPLSIELSDALIHHSGAAGQALSDVLNYEKGDWLAIDSSPIPTEILSSAYLDAINWAKELNNEL